MSFDFAAWKTQSRAAEKNPTLFMLLAGPQGGGKSYTAGTLGVETLYLHGSMETHGPSQAAVVGKDKIVAKCWDVGTPDESYQNLIKILTDPELPNHFGAVVIDSASDLTFGLIRSTNAFAERCRTSKGEHNAFKEGEATLDMLKPIMKALTALKAKKVHVVMTMILDVQTVGTQGEVSIAKPHLPTYGVTVALVPQFDDIAVISYVNNLEPAGHYLQFDVNMKRTSKNATTNATEKVFAITPRITGVPSEKLPQFAKADLSVVAAFKAKEMNSK